MSLHWSKRILLRDAIWWHAPKSHDAFSRQVAPDVCTCSLIFYEKWRHFRFPQKLFLMLVKLHKEGRNLLFYLIREHLTCTRLYELVRQRIAGHDVECIEIAIPENSIALPYATSHSKVALSLSTEEAPSLLLSFCVTRAQFIYGGFS